MTNKRIVALRMYSNWSSDAGSIAVKADTVNDEDEVGSNSNSVVRNCNAISFRLGYNRDSASANAFDVPGTNTTVQVKLVSEQ